MSGNVVLVGKADDAAALEEHGQELGLVVPQPDGQFIVQDLRAVRGTMLPCGIPFHLIVPGMGEVRREGALCQQGSHQQGKEAQQQPAAPYFLRKYTRMGTPVNRQCSRRRFSRKRS